MHKYRVTISPLAASDIHGIYDYISVELINPVAAGKIAASVEQHCRRLSIFPKGSPVRMLRNGRRYRFSRVGKYVVIYHVDDTLRTVRVDRVLYARRDFEAVLSVDGQ